VFLFDDLHLSFDDLAGAQKAGAKALAGVLGGSDMAAVLSLSGNTNSGLTRDRAKLQEAMLSLKSQGNYLHESEACPKIGYYQAYQMERIENIQAFQEARMQVVACGAAADSYQAAQGVRIIAMRVLKDESRDFVASFAAIGEIVHRMGTLPGQRILILVSPGLPILEPEVSAAESRMIDLAAQSNVTVSALDAHGLSATSATAGNENSNEFAVAEVQVAEGALSDLADATGGTFFHNSNDLDSGLKSLTEAPEVVYVLELSLDGVKADGSLHRLKVRVDRPGLDVQARRGYFLPKPEKNKK
jgi:VWFA-related protein